MWLGEVSRRWSWLSCSPLDSWNEQSCMGRGVSAWIPSKIYPQSPAVHNGGCHGQSGRWFIPGGAEVIVQSKELPRPPGPWPWRPALRANQRPGLKPLLRREAKWGLEQAERVLRVERVQSHILTSHNTFRFTSVVKLLGEVTLKHSPPEYLTGH